MNPWTVEFKQSAAKQLHQLDPQSQRRILTFLRERVLASENPRSLGKALTGEKRGLWRYRVGDYRVICAVEDDKLLVLVIAIGHRREIYR